MGYQLVYGQLLIGHSGGRGKLLAFYERIHQAITIPHREVVEFVRSRDLHGLGIGWIDIHLLASALVERCELWTVDSHLRLVAEKLNVAYIGSGLSADID